MLNPLILMFLAAVAGLHQSVLAITVINQTDTAKVIKIEEAYRPVSDRPGNLAAPLSYGYRSKKIKLAAHSLREIPLQTTPPVLLVTVFEKKKGRNKTEETFETSYFEPYDFQDQQAECFNDDWGFVIHHPIKGETLPFFDPHYSYLERAKKRGYGIKCLHPQLLIKVTSLEKLPEDLKMHFDGNAPLSIRKY